MTGIAAKSGILTGRQSRPAGLVLVELMAVMAIMGLMLAIAVRTFGSKMGGSQFETQARQIVNTMVKAQHAASQGGRRYAVIFDLVENKYEVQRIRTLQDLAMDAEVEPKKIIEQTQLSDNCRIDYVRYDDGDDTRDYGEVSSQRVWFVVGEYGWMNGGKIVLLDEDDTPWSIIVNRMGKNIRLEEGDIDTFFLEPVKNLRW